MSDSQLKAVSYGYQVVVTENSEYHFRGVRCIGVRSRISNQWRMDSPMIGLKIRGCALSRKRCLQLPFAGGYLWFQREGKNMFSSKVLSIRIPTDDEIAYFAKREERPDRSVVDGQSPRFVLDRAPSSDRSVDFQHDESDLIVDTPPIDQAMHSQDDDIHIGPIGTLIDQPTAVKAWLSRAEEGFQNTTQLHIGDMPSRHDAEIRKRRVHVRVTLQVEIFIITSAGIFEGITEDISEGGLCVTTFNPQTIGAEIEIDFVLFEEQHRASGLVRWARSIDGGAAAMGIQFESLSERTRSAIVRFVNGRSNPSVPYTP